ncbi:hypothetical protein Lal_00047549 [Lupinus albus]|nr:hypothetical protein Lal_00047549 [Lupinus albus]
MFRRIWSHRATVSVFRTRRNAPSEICSNTPPTAMNLVSPCFSQTLTRFRENQASISVVRFISSKASDRKQGKSTDKTKNEITNVEEDPFSAPTYNIPEKPVTFVEGASYSVIILAGLGIAAAAGYAVFKELIFQPKEYKIYSKALKRIQDDGQVFKKFSRNPQVFLDLSRDPCGCNSAFCGEIRLQLSRDPLSQKPKVRVRIGFPITGYGQESRNRAARQRIPNRVWTDEDGLEHVEVNFYIRGPHGHGKVFSEMFKGPADNEWKFTNLIVEIRAPSSAQLILESYVPDYSPNKFSIFGPFAEAAFFIDRHCGPPLTQSMFLKDEN